jgi:hypothetical protein
LCKTSADAVLKVQGGSTAVRYKAKSALDSDENALTDDGIHDIVLQNNSQDILHRQFSSRVIVPSSAATTCDDTRPNRQDMESFPLRLSTSQMGNNIVIDYVFQDKSLGRNRRNRWRRKRSQTSEIHGYKKYTKKLKVSYNVRILCISSHPSCVL